MNPHKQSKSSIIFSTCWCERGATTNQIFTALEEAGYDMPVEERLLHMLKIYQRRGHLHRNRNKWSISIPYPKKGK